MNPNTVSIPRPVQIWLFIGVVLVFFQVVIGGVTRLTDSGLSITEWSVIQGTLPPLNETEWEAAFEAYKQAAQKQYLTLHADMDMQEFKFIFFWEYFHRLWARMMGFVFILPFLFFLWKKWMPNWLLRRLGVVIILALAAAIFGWIMVKSGLNDDTRTWVSAYKLIIHLGIATSLFAYLFWTWLKTYQPLPAAPELSGLKKISWGITAILFLQILLGGLMAGMRAGLVHPYFPFFVEGQRLYSLLGEVSTTNLSNFIDYEPSGSVKGIVQILHRGVAYLLVGLVIWLFTLLRRRVDTPQTQLGAWLLLSMVLVQFLLGVLTIINSIGKVPVSYGVMHQGGALILLVILLYVNYQFKSTASPQPEVTEI
ncbi:MAG: COX15/CtaA family protein [Phaeodactylibacter sp.]|nr:COX15/CtaA family protein [Phaeodactylibacter sp.]